MKTLPTTIAGSFALSSFAVAVLAGLAGDVRPGSVLFRAIVAMIVCYPVGFGIGLIAERVIRGQLAALREMEGASENTVAAERAAPSADGDEEVIVV